MCRVRLQAEGLQQHHEISIFPEFCCGRVEISEAVPRVECASVGVSVCVDSRYRMKLLEDTTHRSRR